MAQPRKRTPQRGPRQRSAPIFDIAKFAERLYQLRHRHHWTQQELGEQAGVHYVTISKLEKQILPGVSADTIARLARTFGVSMDFLLGLTDEDEDEPAQAVAGEGRCSKGSRIAVSIDAQPSPSLPTPPDGPPALRGQMAVGPRIRASYFYLISTN